MTFWELRVFMINCDHPSCPVEARVECPEHVLYCLPENWVSRQDGRRTLVFCPAHTEEGTG